ncbi:hypothetical protein [Nocardia yunnanensis]|uniref:hypothetical protein n=1 Tax=Nocardia yunnanensis TaxID=2382165 RepID=UPI0013C44E94|nr:hypothetical protein [Nocardia yunnanensis]
MIDPNLTLQVIRELMTEVDELLQWNYRDDDAKLVIGKQETLLYRFVENFEVLDRWMGRGGELPKYWNSQTRTDRIEPMMCCGEPMDVFSAHMGTAFNGGQDCAILVWHCSECGHWEPYEAHFVDPEAIVPNCLCGAAMVDLPVAQWDPGRFRLAWCADCGLYETWGIEPLRRHGNDADDDPRQEQRS